MENWAIVFSISSLINFRIVYIWPIYQSLDQRIWFTILFFVLWFFFIPKRAALCSKYWFFLGGAPTSICHFFCPSFHPSICRVPYPKNHESSNHHLWYTCVKWWYLQYLQYLKGKNSTKWKIMTSAMHHISGTVEDMRIWSWFLVHLCKMICPGVFFLLSFFWKFYFWRC